MRKDEHLKIVTKLKAEIEILQKRIAELSAENVKLDFDSKLNRLLSDQRADALNKMLSTNINNLKGFAKFDTQFKNFYKESMERINLDNEKFDALTDYIKKTFPDAIVEMKPEPREKRKDDEKLSQTFIGENGEVYKPFHVVDLAILIMNTQKEKLKEITGDDFDINSDEE